MVPGVGEVAGPILLMSPESRSDTGLGQLAWEIPSWVHAPPPLPPPFVPELLPFQFLPWRQALGELRVQ